MAGSVERDGFHFTATSPNPGADRGRLDSLDPSFTHGVEDARGELTMTDVDVLVVGAGPVGLTVASELRRRGLGCRIVDRLDAPAGITKAVGIQPRTLEIWEATGVLADALDA